MLVPPSTPASFGRTLVLGGLAASLASVAIATAALASRAPQAPAIDPCTPGFDLGALDDHARTLVARRVLACSDVTHGRISEAEYQRQISAIDAAWTVPVATQIVQWATTVRGFSTQYSPTSWAADRVLGAPDVFPAHGDLANAWASRGADDADEWIEVGFSQPMRAAGVQVFETFNPGAITAIELITATGQRITAYQGEPTAPARNAHRLDATVRCTDEEIVAVHVRLASTRVTGWNELDAIGLVPCTP